MRRRNEYRIAWCFLFYGLALTMLGSFGAGFNVGHSNGVSWLAIGWMVDSAIGVFCSAANLFAILAMHGPRTPDWVRETLGQPIAIREITDAN